MPSAIVIEPPTAPGGTVTVVPLTTNCVTLNTGLSKSMSLLSTLPVAVVSSAMVCASGAGTGASFTATIVTVTKDGGDETWPAESFTVKGIALTAPL